MLSFATLVGSANGGPATGNASVSNGLYMAELVVFYQNVDGSGYQWSHGADRPCDADVGAVDFKSPSDMNSRASWGNVASWAKDWNNCDTKLFAGAGWTTAMTGYINYSYPGRSLAGALNNRTSSYYLS
jgi:hypothetical protein